MIIKRVFLNSSCHSLDHCLSLNREKSKLEYTEQGVIVNDIILIPFHNINEILFEKENEHSPGEVIEKVQRKRGVATKSQDKM
jgi:hypothetical protein